MPNTAVNPCSGGWSRAKSYPFLLDYKKICTYIAVNPVAAKRCVSRIDRYIGADRIIKEQE